MLLSQGSNLFGKCEEKLDEGEVVDMVVLQWQDGDLQTVCSSQHKGTGP